MILAGSVLDPLYNTLGAVLAAVYSVVPSYGFSIAMLTVVVRVALIPLTAKQLRSQRAMQKLQPELKRLQAKHKGDRQKLNEEMMKLYKEHKANPLAGCLPLLLQMPLFIVLYRLLIDLSKQPPRHLPMASELRQALVESGGRMLSWGMDLAERASAVKGVGKALPYYLLVALVVGTGYYQQRQMTARLPKESLNPQMQAVGKIFPVFFGLISLSVPAGVVVYFVVSNLWQIGQQAVAFRPLPQAPPAAAERDRPKTTGAPTKDGAGGQRPKAAGKAGGKAGGKAPAGKAPAGGQRKAQPRQGGQNRAAKGKRPPPAPRPKGLPPAGSKGPPGRAPRKDV